VNQTSLPGVTFGETMTQIAQLAHKLTVVRSYQTNNGGHNIQPLVGPDSQDAYVGSYYSRIAGPARSDTGMPTNVVLFNQAVSKDVTKGAARGSLSTTGALGSSCAPFVPGSDGDLQKDMRLNLPHARFFDDRRALLSALDDLGRGLDANPAVSELREVREQAFALLKGSGVADALDLTQEDPAVRAAYDTSRYVRKDGWSKANRGKRGYYTGEAQTIGPLLLMARRLCEAGCGFVTVHASYEGVWDMHADGNNLNMHDGMQAVGRSFDHAVAAFVQDLEARGLSDKILLVCSGEMGRTPRLNKNGGRDHWAKLAPLLMYGGGLRGGQVIGQSTRDGAEPLSDPLTPKHLIATILGTVFDVGQLRLVPNVPAQVLRVAQQPTIPGLG
jgi:hypothetical protein